MVFTDFEDFWTLQSEVSGPIALLIASLPRTTWPPSAARWSRCSRLRDADGYEVPSLAIGVSAR